MTPSKLAESVVLLSVAMESESRIGKQKALLEFAAAIREAGGVYCCEYSKALTTAGYLKVKDGAVIACCDGCFEKAKQPPESIREEGREKFSCKGQTGQVYCNDPDCGDRDPQGLHYTTGDPRKKPPEPVPQMTMEEAAKITLGKTEPKGCRHEWHDSKYQCGKPPKPPEPNMCAHCGGDIAIRNPKGFCDHLHYPDSCATCFFWGTKTSPPPTDLPAEVKECECGCHENINPIQNHPPGTTCGCKPSDPPTKIPKEVRERISEHYHYLWSHVNGLKPQHLQDVLENIARLCLGIAERGSR